MVLQSLLYFAKIVRRVGKQNYASYSVIFQSLSAHELLALLICPIINLDLVCHKVGLCVFFVKILRAILIDKNVPNSLSGFRMLQAWPWQKVCWKFLAKTTDWHLKEFGSGQLLVLSWHLVRKILIMQNSWPVRQLRQWCNVLLIGKIRESMLLS